MEGPLGALASAWSWAQKGPGALCAHRQLSNDTMIHGEENRSLLTKKRVTKNVIGLCHGKVSRHSHLLAGGPAASDVLETGLETLIKSLEMYHALTQQFPSKDKNLAPLIVILALFIMRKTENNSFAHQ